MIDILGLSIKGNVSDYDATTLCVSYRESQALLDGQAYGPPVNMCQRGSSIIDSDLGG